MKMNKKRLLRESILAVALIAGLSAAGFYVSGRIARAAESRIGERWALYVEGLKSEGKLVVLSSSQRFTASREFTSKLLAVVRLKASLELSAWAEVHYYLDVSDPSRWSVRWDPKARRLSMEAPEPECLLPAVRTETIEVRAKGANLVTNTVFKLKEEATKMKDELSSDLLERAREAMKNPELREAIRAGAAKAGGSFCLAALGIEAAEVAVSFAGDSTR